MLGEITTNTFSEIPRGAEARNSRETGLAARAEGFRARDTQEKNGENDRFEAILKKIAGEDKKTEKDSEKTVEKLENKVQELEKKIEALAKDPEKSKDIPVEEIKAALDKIKALLENTKKSGSQVKLDFGNISVDLVQLLAEMVQKLTDSLNSQGGKDFLKLFKVIEDKITSVSKGHELGIKAGMTLNQNASDPSKADKEAAESVSSHKMGLEEQNKVKVVDKRTEQDGKEQLTSKDKALQAGAVENSHMLKTTALDHSQQTTAKGLQESLKTDNSAKGVESKDQIQTTINENNAAQSVKSDQSPGVFNRQYVSFSSTVNKANLEALMENITARAVVTLRDGKSEIKMNLVPPELGKMNMKFTFEDGILAGKIVVSTPEAKMLFDQNLGDLQRALQQAGINMGSLNVSLGQPDSGSTQDKADKGIHTQAIQDVTSLKEAEMTEESERAHRLYDSSIYYVA